MTKIGNKSIPLFHLCKSAHLISLCVFIVVDMGQVSLMLSYLHQQVFFNFQ